MGSYVDPGLAERLLTESGAVFPGERRTVSVLFVDVRDFTPYAETVTPEPAVARLSGSSPSSSRRSVPPGGTVALKGKSSPVDLHTVAL